MPTVSHRRSPPRTGLLVALIGGWLFLTGVVATAIVLVPLLPPGTGVALQQHPEFRAFASRYGPAQHSQFGEEWLIRDFFQGKRDGVFVDVGASDYRQFSNTYYLETELGWSGVAVDPLRQFEKGYRLHRPRTRFFPFFVSDRSNELARIYSLDDNTQVTSSAQELTAAFGDSASETTVPTITLNDLLEQAGIAKIDFMSMDVELAEPQALAGFDIARFRPDLVCIEARSEVRQAILDYFARHEYVAVAKYLRADIINLYFTPLPPAEP